MIFFLFRFQTARRAACRHACDVTASARPPSGSLAWRLFVHSRVGRTAAVSFCLNTRRFVAITMDTTKKKHYKYCIVPMCTNTSITTPGKHFFNVPKKKKIRDKWCKVMKRKETLSDKSVRYCCEDHFDVSI